MPGIPHPDDTIAALASAAGSAERGIVRVSGSDAVAIVRELIHTSTNQSEDISAFHCTPRLLRISGFRSPVPVDLCVWPRERSYTREPLVELHLPGSPPILEGVLGDLYSRGARPAQAGEFTLRAFLAGRVDLLQAEAVLGVIDARDRHNLLIALEQLGGGVSSQMVRLRSDLLDLLADLEAGLDFADEAIEFVSHPTLRGRLGLTRDELQSVLDRAGARLRSSLRPSVVLAGRPNAGKSSLFNALIEDEAALVSDVSGTTRDYLAAEIDAGGVPITLLDTAGDEPAAEGVMGEAQNRRREVLDRADLVVWCHPADAGEPAVDAPQIDESRLLPVVTKADLLVQLRSALCVSSRTGFGLDLLRSLIAQRLASSRGDESGLLGTTAARCRESLLGAVAALDRALAIARREADQELLAIEIREALEELGKVVGAVYTDDVLDRIFSKFCIGK